MITLQEMAVFNGGLVDLQNQFEIREQLAKLLKNLNKTLGIFTQQRK